MRAAILQRLYKLFPFDLKGDCCVPPARDRIRVSCIINFYGRLNVLEGILWCLVQQHFPREAFEVVLVEDRGGTAEGRALAQQFSNRLPIVYFPLDNNYGHMGYSRNFGIQHSQGEVILFLDDDTVILQNDFLSQLVQLFETHVDCDAIVPYGRASYSLIAGKYGFHDPHFMTSRCTAYRRDALAELAGFISDFIGQEDVEFAARFHMKGLKPLYVNYLEYFHPPLLIDSIRKPMAVGISMYRTRNRYPVLIWALFMLNCMRHLPFVISPIKRWREQGRFALGFLCGAVNAIFKRDGCQYR